MFFPTISMDYYSALPQDCFMQNFNSEYMKVMMLNRELSEKNTLLMQKIQTLENEAQQQKK